MKAASTVEILQECLERIARGASPEEALAAYPAQARELRPLLETALQARALREEIAVPHDAQLRSRAQFIQAATRPRRTSFRSIFRTGWSIASLLVALALVLGGTGFASAQSLPGDQLYPVKIAAEQARLGLVSDPAQRLQIKAVYDRERVDEVEALLTRDGSHPVEVDFAGFLSLPDPQGDWMVSGIRLALPVELKSLADLQPGRYVDVHGAPLPGGRVQVESIHLRVEKVSGAVESVDDHALKVDQLTVDLTSQTHLSTAPSVGDVIEAEVAPQEDGSLRAFSVNVAHETEHPTRTVTTTATATLAVERHEASPTQTAAHSVVPSGGESEDHTTVQHTPEHEQTQSHSEESEHSGED
jgi:hypothetical protein